MKRLQNVQGLRAIAAVLVVFVHLGGPQGFTATNLGHQDPFWLVHPIGNTGVDLFFAISGLIMIVTTTRVRHGLSGAGKFLLRRAIRIYPPYVVVTLILFIPRIFHPARASTTSGLLPSLTLWPTAEFPILFVGWTLTYEMYFYLIFAASILVPNRYKFAVLAGWAALTVAVALTVSQLSPLLGLIGGPLNLEFLLGVAVGQMLLTNRLRAPVASIIVGVAGVLVTYLLWIGPGHDVPNAWVRVLGVGLPAALILYGVVGLEHKGTRLPKKINQLGDMSYALYLVHPIVLAGAGVAVRRLPPTPVVAVLVGLGVLVIAFIAAVIFRRLVEQPLLKVLQRLTSRGTRHPKAAVATDVAP
jgi:peptidoglycan/LPS O-acetylase OafA/YrhL